MLLKFKKFKFSGNIFYFYYIDCIKKFYGKNIYRILDLKIEDYL